MRFICDDNLGKLAKYLRILGFDTYFQESLSNPVLLRIAASEKRYLLTRDGKLMNMSHPYGVLLLERDDPLEQLRTAVSALNLQINPDVLFSRCSVCNDVCVKVDKNVAGSHVFPYILQTQDVISQCPSCKRFYWKGTHYRKLLRMLRSAIPDKAIDGRWPE